MKRYRFKIVPVIGQAFEVVKFADTSTEAYEKALKLYGQYALDIVPLGMILKTTKEK